MKFLLCIAFLVSLIICSLARPQTTFEDGINKDEIIRQKRHHRWGMGYGGMGGMGYGGMGYGGMGYGMGNMGYGGMGYGMGYPMMGYGMYGRK
uniref:Uncharacterized protein n=1 Tax=Acrobeloides nanus TaxID=290746 RepID=A0A914DLR3_9BILA